ncbi:MAG: response regulator [Chloroflexi bacterium]|nr:response regulator [Chloroflexota bacterium]
MKIMYVEDNPANISLLQRIARMGGHEVINYTNGETALNNFEQDHADLVLMDLQLEGRFSGLDVVKELRSRGFKTPIVAVTAYAMVGDRERCIEAGCDSYLSKPLPVAELVEMVHTYEEKFKPSPVPVAVVPASETKEAPPATAQPETPAVKPPETTAEVTSAPAPEPTPEPVEKPAVAEAPSPAAETTTEPVDQQAEEPTEPSRDATLDLVTSRSSNHVSDPKAQTGSA